MTDPGPSSPTLARRLGLPLMVLYGIGTIVGAGIYALIGAVAARAGAFAPLSFVVAALLVSCTALTFAELSARLPFAAGEAVYIREGLRMPRLGTAIAMLIALGGCVSAATISNAFVGYLDLLVEIPRAAAILGFAAALGVIAIWGIHESVLVAGAMTLIEIGGLLLVIAVGSLAIPEGHSFAAALSPAADLHVWSGILAASLLAFFAFIGFEDMVNVAEEVRDVERTLPRAIVLVLVITSALYLTLALIAVAVVPPDELAASDAPLALVYQRATGNAPAAFGVVSIVALANGALIQIIMCSRILYGLARQGSLPAIFGTVNAATRTPIFATMVASSVVATLALWFPLVILAQSTSAIMLVSFTFVNAALVGLKRRDPHPQGVRVYPTWVPRVGFLVSLAFLAYAVADLARRM